MNPTLYQTIANSTAHRQSRDRNTALILKNLDLLPDLMAIAFDVKDKNHFKACWVLELVFEHDLTLLEPFLNRFCESLSKYKHDSAIRPISKICQFLSQSKKITLTKIQQKQITEACLDWLIQDEKVAAKVYAMRALYHFGKTNQWIHEELKVILSQDYPHHTAAYKVGARDVLKQLNKT